jgi:hypothetical protein
MAWLNSLGALCALARRLSQALAMPSVFVDNFGLPACSNNVQDAHSE